LIPNPRNAERWALFGEHGGDTKRCFERFLEKKHMEATRMAGARISGVSRVGAGAAQIGNGEVYLVVTRQRR